MVVVSSVEVIQIVPPHVPDLWRTNQDAVYYFGGGRLDSTFAPTQKGTNEAAFAFQPSNPSFRFGFASWAMSNHKTVTYASHFKI